MMQYEVIRLSKSKILECIKKLDGKSCRVFLYLSCLSNEDDVVEVVPGKLAKELSVSKATLVSALKILRELGMICVIGTTSNGLGHVYRISVDDSAIERIIQTKLL
jgi:DNA-binding MarR family transcriptional regulator